MAEHPPSLANTRMPPTDAFLWYMEDDPLLRSTVVAVALLDRAPDWDQLVDRVGRASRLAPGFRQKVVEPPARLATPQWVTDPDFDLAYHLRRTQAPAAGGLDAVLERARTMGMASFDKARPLWEFLLVEGLQGERAALVMKVHHALTDGIGGMQIALFLYDLEREAAPPDVPPDEEARRLGDLDVLREALGHDLDELVGFARRNSVSALPALVHAALHPASTASGVLRTLQSIGRLVAPVNETMSPVMTDRRLGWRYQVLDLPSDALKAAANGVGAKMNDAFLAGLTGGLRRYHEHHGTPVDQLRVSMPISLRTDGHGVGGNHVTLVRFPVPVALEEPAQRIRTLRRLATTAREEPGIAHSEAIATGLNALPRGVVGAMLKHIDFLASNVPGFRFPVYLCGSEVLRLYPFGPTIGASANCTLLSYRDTAGIGITTDTGAVPDGDVLLTCMAMGFEEVLALAGGHPPVQPGGPALAAPTP